MNPKKQSNMLFAASSKDEELLICELDCVVDLDINLRVY